MNGLYALERDTSELPCSFHCVRIHPEIYSQEGNTYPTMLAT